MRNFNLPEMVKHYAIAALWSTNDDSDTETGGAPMDTNYTIDDISAATMAEMQADCADFTKNNQADLLLYCEKMAHGEWSGEAMAGQDFWLTRNRHGAGFWDRGLGELGQRLTRAAQVSSGVDLYVGDDGKIHA